MEELDSPFPRGERWLGALLAGEGCALMGMWAQSLKAGAFRNGLITYQDGNYPVLHLSAEGLMGGALTAAGFGLWTRARWGRQVALFALGLLSYSSINSSGWALHNKPVLAIPMGLTLATAAMGIVRLTRPLPRLLGQPVAA
jgi:hypothetical protein